MTKKKIKSWLYVVLWLAVIYYFSNQPNLKSELEYFYDLIFRKIAHMAEYFVLAYLLYKALSNYKLSFRQIMVSCLVLSFLAAGFDEIHQSFIAGRSASFFDVIIDGIGAIVMVVLILKERFGSLFENYKLPK